MHRAGACIGTVQAYLEASINEHAAHVCGTPLRLARAGMLVLDFRIDQLVESGRAPNFSPLVTRLEAHSQHLWGI